MDIDARLLYFLIGSNILLLAIIVSLVISHISAGNRLKDLEANEDELYKKTLQEEKELARKAQTDYQQVIEEANQRARDIISQAAKINDDTRGAVTQALTVMSESEKQQVQAKSAEFLKQYKNELEKVNEENVQVFQGLSEKMSTEINAHFDELKKLLAAQTVDSKKNAEEKIKAEYEELEKQLKKYREEQFQKIDQNIYDLLLRISKVAFGYGLNFQEHQGLIIEALERAKTEGDLALS